MNVWVEGRDESYEADYVINTVPLGVLKSGKISFVPEIEDSNQLKQDAIDNLEMGMFNKVYLIFPAIEDETELVWYEDKNIDWISRIPKVEDRGE